MHNAWRQREILDEVNQKVGCFFDSCFSKLDKHQLQVHVESRHRRRRMPVPVPPLPYFTSGAAQPQHVRRLVQEWRLPKQFLVVEVVYLLRIPELLPKVVQHLFVKSKRVREPDTLLQHPVQRKVLQYGSVIRPILEQLRYHAGRHRHRQPVHRTPFRNALQELKHEPHRPEDVSPLLWLGFRPGVIAHHTSQRVCPQLIVLAAKALLASMLADAEHQQQCFLHWLECRKHFHWQWG